MNRYARAVISEFLTKENEAHLARCLMNTYNDTRVLNFLKQQLRNSMTSFSYRMESELSMSDVMPGITLMDQVNCFNDQFLDERCDYIEKYIIDTSRQTPTYMVTDDIPTSRHGPSHYQKSANELLKTWEKNARGGVQTRDDVQGDAYVIGGEANTNNLFVSHDGGKGGVGGSRVIVKHPSHEGFAGHRDGNGLPRSYNPTYGQGNHSMKTGVVFCDQSELGTSNHIDMLVGHEYFQMLNRDPQPHTADAFGNATPASDARLLQRRIFRSNEYGEENGIPRYEQRLYKKMYYMERDVSESLRSGERDCLIHGYDMSDLRNRVYYKNSVKANFQPGCNDRNKLMLGNSTMPTPAVNRYSNCSSNGQTNIGCINQTHYM